MGQWGVAHFELTFGDFLRCDPIMPDTVPRRSRPSLLCCSGDAGGEPTAEPVPKDELLYAFTKPLGS